jgi:transcriptional regulator with XRE-family HTH domain
VTATQAVELRKRLEINKAGFARLLGVGVTSVARWESGNTPRALIVGSTAEVLAAFDRALRAGGVTAEAAKRIAKDAEEGRAGLGVLVEKMLRGEK